MAKGIFRELVTINGKNVVLAHKESPVSNAGVLENADLFRMINIFDEKFSPTNIDKADGTPLRLYTSARVKVDVSKRRKHDMGFRHRNIDAHEIIFCVKGAHHTAMAGGTDIPQRLRGDLGRDREHY